MRKQLLNLGIAFVMMLILAACSGGSSQEGLLEKIPANADFAAVGNAKNIIESGGGTIEGSKITLPSLITDLMSNREKTEMNEALDLLEKSGVNIEAGGIVVNSFMKGRPIFVLGINDADKFTKYIKEQYFNVEEEADGVTYYLKKHASDYGDEYTRFQYIAIDGYYAYVSDDVYSERKNDIKETIQNIIADAKDKSLADTKFGAYISEGNVGGMAINIPEEGIEEIKSVYRKNGMDTEMLDIVDGVICLNGDLTGNTAKINMKFFNHDGTEKSTEFFEKYMNVNAKVSSKALSYMGKDESLIYAAAAEDINWDEYMNMVANAGNLGVQERSAMTLVKTYMEKFNGTVAIGVGMPHGLRSVLQLNRPENILNELTMTIVCETKDGEAEKLLKDATSMLDGMRMSYTETNDGINITIPQGLGTVYAKADNNTIILSNHEISNSNDNLTVDKVNLTDYSGGLAIALDREHQLMKDLGLDNSIVADITFDTPKMESTMTLSVDGEGSEGIITNIIKACMKVAENQNSIQRTITGGDSSY